MTCIQWAAVNPQAGIQQAPRRGLHIWRCAWTGPCARIYLEQYMDWIPGTRMSQTHRHRQALHVRRALAISIGTWYQSKAFNHSVLVEGCVGRNLSGAYTSMRASARSCATTTGASIKEMRWWSASARPRGKGGGGNLSSGDIGLLVTSDYMASKLTIESMAFNGSAIAVDVSVAEVDLVDCTLRAVDAEVYAHGGAWVHLRGCNHTRLSCVSEDGEIADLVDVECSASRGRTARPSRRASSTSSPATITRRAVSTSRSWARLAPHVDADRTGSWEVRTLRATW